MSRASPDAQHLSIMRLAAADTNHYIYPPMIKFDKNLIYYKLPPFVFAALIITLSSMSGISPPSLGVSWTDKIYHFGEYFAFAFLIFRAFSPEHSSPKRTRYYVILFLFGLVFGAIDEKVQYYIPFRDCSIFDLMADAIGYTVSGTVFILFRVMFKKQA
jgi:VanZ family protein